MNDDFRHIAVALDLRQRSDGALLFASWLQSARLKAGQARVPMSGLHVIEAGQIADLRDVPTYDQLIFHAQRDLRDTVERLGADGVFTEMRVLDGGDVVEQLMEYVRQHETDALIIGRAGSVEGYSLRRLGKVARHLLRQLAVPTIVVPPDLWQYEIGQGPVVVAVDGTDKSLAAVHFARRLAQSIGRELVGIHVINIPGYWACGTFAAQVAASTMPSLRATVERGLLRWAQDRHLADLRLILAEGSTCEKIHQSAQELSACALVTGSRRLSTVERFFVSSVGSELAASAQIPIAIVPPTTFRDEDDNLRTPQGESAKQHHPS